MKNECLNCQIKDNEIKILKEELQEIKTKFASTNSSEDDFDLGTRQCGVNEKEDCESCQ